MEIVLELLFEIVGQVVFEFLLEGVFRGVARLLSNRIVRVVLGGGLAVAVGYGGGYWWGSRLTELGRTDPPKSLWVSVSLVVFFLALALVRMARREVREENASPQREWIAERLLPWRWSLGRLLGFALLNAAVAAGIAVGFDPQVLR